MSNETVFAVEHVSKTFADTSPGTAVLAELSFTVGRGEFVSIVGPSGSGKTTLLRLAADLDTPSQGNVLVCGHAPAVARERRELGIVFQAPVLYAWRTVEGNVALPLDVAGVEAEERRQRVAATLELVGLTDVADRYPRQLSGGMQQRVAIARALVGRPRLLLLDEPFSALDEPARERMNDELLRLWSELGITVLFVTHDLEEGTFLADRLLVLTPRPARLAAQIEIDLPRPRDAATRLDPAYFRLIAEAREVLRAGAAV